MQTRDILATTTPKNLPTCSWAQKSESEISVLTAAEDYPIDFSNGDIFIALDLQPEVQTFQAPFTRACKIMGLMFVFVIYDLLPVTLPDCFPPSADLNHAKWLEVASEADGVICISICGAKAFNAGRHKNILEKHITDLSTGFIWVLIWETPCPPLASPPMRKQCCNASTAQPVF